VVLKHLLSDITLEVAQRAPRWSLFHAGAVAWGNAGIVLAGPSGSGKSTLVAALLRLGATYYSDEVAVIDGSGRLHPFLKPVWLYLGRPDELGHKTALHAASLGARSGTRACPVHVVAFPEWRAGSRVRARPMPRATAALALFSNGFTSERRPGRTLRHATRAVESASCLHIRYPDAERAARVLLSLLESGNSTSQDWSGEEPADRSVSVLSWGTDR
jgi:energy-coupling factor transporter ATP-binding protein EcfA2